MTTADEELAAAVAGREHWRLDGPVAVYALPGARAEVRVRPMAMSTRPRIDRYGASVVRDDRAAYSTQHGTAVGAVSWAERQRLT